MSISGSSDDGSDSEGTVFNRTDSNVSLPDLSHLDERSRLDALISLSEDGDPHFHAAET